MTDGKFTEIDRQTFDLLRIGMQLTDWMTGNGGGGPLTIADYGLGGACLLRHIERRYENHAGKVIRVESKYLQSPYFFPSGSLRIVTDPKPAGLTGDAHG